MRTGSDVCICVLLSRLFEISKKNFCSNHVFSANVVFITQLQLQEISSFYFFASMLAQIFQAYVVSDNVKDPQVFPANLWNGRSLWWLLSKYFLWNWNFYFPKQAVGSYFWYFLRKFVYPEGWILIRVFFLILSAFLDCLWELFLYTFTNNIYFYANWKKAPEHVHADLHLSIAYGWPRITRKTIKHARSPFGLLHIQRWNIAHLTVIITSSLDKWETNTVGLMGGSQHRYDRRPVFYDVVFTAHSYKERSGKKNCGIKQLFMHEIDPFPQSCRRGTPFYWYQAIPSQM